MEENFQFVLWSGDLLHIEAYNKISEIATMAIKYRRIEYPFQE